LRTQPGQCLADGGLGQVQLARGRRHAVTFEQYLKGEQQVQVHASELAGRHCDMNLDHEYEENMSLGIISLRRYRVRHGSERRTEMTIIAIVAIVCLGLLAGVAATEVATA
jgi:hypothetical protein